jgi:hypothetical protein
MITNRGSHGSLDPGEIRLACDRVNRDGVKFDLQVGCALVECSMGGRGNDPEEILNNRKRSENHTPTFQAQ